MSSKTSFVKQAAILAAASLLVRLIGFFYRLPLHSLIGDEGIGIYGRAYNFYTFLFILSSAGLPAAIAKMVSERTAKNEHANAYQVFRVSLVVSSAAGLIAALVLGLGASRLASFVDPQGAPSSVYAIRSLAPTVFIVALISVFRGYFQGLKNNVPTAASQVVEQIFNAVFSVYLAYALSRYGIAFAAAGGTIGTGIGAFAGLIVILLIYFAGKKSFLRIPRTSRPLTEPDRKITRELFKTAIPIIAGTAIFSFANLVDNVTVSTCLTKAGVFSAQRITELFGQLEGKYVTLVTLPVSLATALATTVVPHIAAINVSKNKVSLHSKINVALKLTMVISIPAAMGIGVLATPILSMLIPKYPEGASLLTVGAVSIVFLSLAQIATGMLQGIGKVRVPAFGAFLGVIVKIPVNILLISNPAINIHGAVIGTTACYIIASTIDIVVLIRCTGVRIAWADIFAKPAMAAAVMGVCCYVFYHFPRLMFGLGNTVSCLIAVGGGMLVYMVYLLNMGGVTAEDMSNIPGGEKLAQICGQFGIPV